MGIVSPDGKEISSKPSPQSIDVILRATILALQEKGGEEKAKDMKDKYLNEVVKPSIKAKLASKTKEEIQRIRLMEKLDADIVKARLEIIEEILGEK